MHHLNLGRGLIDDAAERLALARLNLSAGRKAKSATAHEAALGYLDGRPGAARRRRSGATDYELAFALHLEAAECEYLCGHFDEAEQQFAPCCAAPRAASTGRGSTGCAACSTRTCRATPTRWRPRATCARALRRLACPMRPRSAQAALEREIAAIQSLLGGRTIASLVDLPVMTDPEIRMVMNMLTDIWASAYILGGAGPGPADLGDDGAAVAGCTATWRSRPTAT